MLKCFLSAGKTFSMVGRDETVHSLGIAPCSIAWLFKLIDEKRERWE
jgi:kinesin family protein 26